MNTSRGNKEVKIKDKNNKSVIKEEGKTIIKGSGAKNLKELLGKNNNNVQYY